MQKTTYYVYIMCNQTHTVYYTGVTHNLIKRVYEHKSKIVEGFTQKYNITQLVYFEVHDSIFEAIIREKKIKRWHRKWKIDLIKETNPRFEDLYTKIY